MDYDEQEMMKLARSAVNRLQIDRFENDGEGYKDAMQEACLYYCQGKNVLTELTKWKRGQDKVKDALGLTSDTSIEDPSNQDNRLNARVDEVKSI